MRQATPSFGLPFQTSDEMQVDLLSYTHVKNYIYSRCKKQCHLRHWRTGFALDVQKGPNCNRILHFVIMRNTFSTNFYCSSILLCMIWSHFVPPSIDSNHLSNNISTVSSYHFVHMVNVTIIYKSNTELFWKGCFIPNVQFSSKKGSKQHFLIQSGWVPGTVETDIFLMMDVHPS